MTKYQEQNKKIGEALNKDQYNKQKSPTDYIVKEQDTTKTMFNEEFQNTATDDLKNDETLSKRNKQRRDRSSR